LTTVPDTLKKVLSGHFLTVAGTGATDFRYGWATSDKPYTGLNGMAKYKDRKTNKQLLLFGDAIEADPASRLATKLTWEGDILANPEALVRHMCSALRHSLIAR